MSAFTVYTAALHGVLAYLLLHLMLIPKPLVDTRLAAFGLLCWALGTAYGIYVVERHRPTGNLAATDLDE